MNAPGSSSFQRSFTATFKRTVILFTESTNNCAAGRKLRRFRTAFDVSSGRLQRAQIFNCDGRQRKFRGSKVGRFPELEAKLAANVANVRDQSLPVTCDMITEQALKIVSETGIPRTQFKASRAWASKFMKWAGFSLCQRTSAYEEKVLAYHRYFLKLHDSWQHFIGQIGNADHAPVCFHTTGNTTVNAKGDRKVKLLTTENEKLFHGYAVLLGRRYEALPVYCVQAEDSAIGDFSKNCGCVRGMKGYLMDNMVVE